MTPQNFPDEEKHQTELIRFLKDAYKQLLTLKKEAKKNRNDYLEEKKKIK